MTDTLIHVPVSHWATYLSKSLMHEFGVQDAVGQSVSLCKHKTCQCDEIRGIYTVGSDSRSECRDVDCHHYDVQQFDRCSNFDENDCSNCNEEVVILGPDRGYQGVDISTLQKPQYHRLNGIIKPCNSLTLKFKLYISPELSDVKDSTGWGYKRGILRLSQNPEAGWPTDSRPAFYLDQHNRLVFYRVLF